MKTFQIILSAALLLTGQYAYAEDKVITPKEALEKLVQGNKRFMNDTSKCPARTAERRLALTNKQKPFAVIVGCSDSRTSPEIIFDQGIGDLFIIRLAGNVVDDIGLESILYSVKVNGSCLVMVLGHENCGAVSAVINHYAEGVPAIARLIEKATVGLKKHSLYDAVIANVQYTVNELKRMKAFKSLIEQGKLEIVGGYYHFLTGQVDILKN
jgi:carbonic anhydrase